LVKTTYAEESYARTVCKFLFPFYFREKETRESWIYDLLKSVEGISNGR